MNPREPRAPRPSSAKTPVTRMAAVRDQCRCTCGSMLARVVREGLELKCRKCKSLVLITHEELVRMYQEQNFTPVRFMAPQGPPRR